VAADRARAAAGPVYEVRASEIQGRGLFARRPIDAGTRIIEYGGEVISAAEGDRRYDESRMDRHETYLFALADGRCIDGASQGNDARFANHCCEPNCEAVEVEGRIWIEALRPIAPGEELTYDYGYERSEGDDARESFYRCGCGAPRCRSTILAPREDGAAAAG
jgi:SET domain-containing protein